MKPTKPQPPEPSSDNSTEAAQTTPEVDRDFFLTPHDAEAGGPADASVTGEEDPGAGLEFLVKKTH